MDEDLANFSDLTKSLIFKKVIEKNKKNLPSLQAFREENNLPKTINVKKIFRKKKSFDRSEASYGEKEEGSIFNKSLSTTFENKSVEDEDSKGSLKRISEFMKAKKNKMISKDRTMYHQRKNTYLPKKMSMFADFDIEFKGTKTETSLGGEGRT